MANPRYSSPTEPPPETPVVATLGDGKKVKVRIPRMRACNEKDEKGKLCVGHLKRFFGIGPEVTEQFGANVEIYRCEKCQTLYLPNPEEEPRSGTLSW